MSLVSFETPWKYQKTSSYLMYSGGNGLQPQLHEYIMKASGFVDKNI